MNELAQQVQNDGGCFFVPLQRSATGQGETHERLFNQEEVSSGHTHHVYHLMH